MPFFLSKSAVLLLIKHVWRNTFEDLFGFPLPEISISGATRMILPHILTYTARMVFSFAIIDDNFIKKLFIIQ